MTINECKMDIRCYVECYQEGRYTVSECLQCIDKFIQRETWYLYHIDEKISKQNKLYQYGLKALNAAIEKMDKH